MGINPHKYPELKSDCWSQDVKKILCLISHLLRCIRSTSSLFQSSFVTVLLFPRSNPWLRAWFEGRIGMESEKKEMGGSSGLLDLGFLSSEKG